MLALLFCLLLNSCARQSLPPIKDAALLCADCTALFQKFPTEENPTNASTDAGISKFHTIPKDQWPASIAALNPAQVSKNVAGIWIFIASKQKNPPIDPQNGCMILGYFVLTNPGKMHMPSGPEMLRMSPISYGFIFIGTDLGNIFQLEQPMKVL